MNILIVEDEARIAKRIERFSQEILGDALQSLVHHGTLHEAVGFMESHTPDLVLLDPVSYTHLRAHETKANLVCRLLLEKKNQLQRSTLL